jgi:mannose-6-phosphate isomerase-like protein (cupin superfamily)
MGMWWEITRSTVDTSGELFEATNWVEARMPGPPVHVHPTVEESYEVIEGALEVFMDGKWSPVRAGERRRCLRVCRTRYATPQTNPQGS